MLESLKDLYISYPFLPLPQPPDFFRHIKDVRLVLELPAADLLLGYKKGMNGNYIRVWLTGFVPADGTNEAYATAEVECLQASDDAFDIRLPLAVWTAGVPATQNWLMCDQELLDDLPVFGDSDRYELNPDVLVLQQVAPVIYKDGVALTDLTVVNGHNVQVNLTNGQISLYGAPGVGDNVYPANTPELYQLSLALQAAGARSINGLSGDVRIDGTFPVRTDNPVSEGDTLSLNIKVEDTDAQN